MNTKPMFSSGKDDWETPDDLFDSLNTEFHFVLDAAADLDNHKCPLWFGDGGVETDALTADWGPWLKLGTFWLNPPYSRGLQKKFVEKAVAEVEAAASGKVVCLLPSRTDTALFHDTISKKGKITFLRGRLKFKGAANSAPFPSMIVVFE